MDKIDEIYLRRFQTLNPIMFMEFMNAPRRFVYKNKQGNYEYRLYDKEDNCFRHVYFDIEETTLHYLKI